VKLDNFKFLRVLIGVLLLVSFSYGCATMVLGTTQGVLIETPYLIGASCDLIDSVGTKYSLASTPGKVTVNKGDGPLSIYCKKDGYENGFAQVDEILGGMTTGVAYIDLLSIPVDMATGAWQAYPPTTIVWMKPYKFVSKDEEDRWRADKKVYDDAIAKKEAERADPMFD
jgi:hypothetical protein